MDGSDDDLAAAVRELSETLRELRRELEREGRSRRRRAFRVPWPDDLLRFADDVALPGLIALLRANVRALEALQRALALARRQRETRDRTREATETAQARADDLGRRALDQLDVALSELQSAFSGGGAPDDDRARDLLADARELRDEVDRRLRDATDEVDAVGDRGHTIEIDDEDDADDESAVDVDAELETLRDRYGPGADDGADDDGVGGEDGGGNEDADDGGAGDGGDGGVGNGDGDNEDENTDDSSDDAR